MKTTRWEWKVDVKTFEGERETLYVKGTFAEAKEKAREESARRIMAHEDGFMIVAMTPERLIRK